MSNRIGIADLSLSETSPFTFQNLTFYLHKGNILVHS